MQEGRSRKQKQTTGNFIYLRCTNYYRSKCPEILESRDKTVLEAEGIHNHDCDPIECKVIEIVNPIKRATQFSTPTVASAYEIFEISDYYKVQLAMAKLNNLLRAVSGKRRKEMCSPMHTPTDRYFEVPDEFAPCVLQDIGRADKQILIFRDATVKSLLTSSNTWLSDEAFRLSPELFCQIYAIHVELHRFDHPVYIYCYRTKQEKPIID